MSIALFDSGIGGLTVLYEARKRMPSEDYIFYADTLHVPYGSKPKEKVKDYILSAVRSIMEQDVKALVVACNTATSVAIQDLRAMYNIPIVGMEPAVKPAVEMNRSSGRRVLVAATPLTLKESKFHELVKRVDDRSIVDTLPLPELVEYCEDLVFEGEMIESYFQQKLSGFQLEHYGTLVLGCTHYPFYRSVLSRILPAHMKIIDGSGGTAKRLQEVVKPAADAKGEGSVRFMCSDENPEYLSKMRRALQIYSEMQA